MTHEGQLYLGHGDHRIWINTPCRPQALDVWITDMTPHHCGGHKLPRLGPVHVYNHGFEFEAKVHEGTAEIHWRYEV